MKLGNPDSRKAADRRRANPGSLKGRKTSMEHQRDADESPAASCDLRVGGMDCPSCAESIKASLRGLEGIQDVQVDVLGGWVRVRYAEGKLARGDIAGAITRVGFPVVDGEVRRASFIVEGMDCAEEVRQIEDKLGRLPGVTNLQFDLLNRRLSVEGAITSAEIKRALRGVGLTARPEGEDAKPSRFWQRRGRLVLMGISGLFLSGGLALEWAGVGGIFSIPLFALSTLAGAWYIAPRAYRAARNLTLDMNFLMMVSAVGASVIGEWAEGASVVFLFSLAQVLETYSMDRARNAIKALMDLSPTEATVRRDGEEMTIPAADVAVGEIIVIRPGQKIPLDGKVVAGRSAVNQAPITGESLPVGKEPGSEVFAGSINEQGLLEVRVTKLVADTTLARIIHAVEEAQASRAPSQSFVDRFSRIYTPAVVAFAVLVLLLPPLLGFGPWSVWFYRALAMLVIACPCALVISTPVSLVSGLAGAARSGILIKGGLHLENAGKITAMAFDKTGTLTYGRPAVTDVMSLGSIEDAEILRLAASIEQGSEHPLARAILEKAKADGLPLAPAADFEALVGRGVRARIQGGDYYLGNERLCLERGVCTPQSEEALDRFAREGKTAVLLASANEPLGIIAIADIVRPEARQSIEALRSIGIRHVIMLTGDNAGTARAVGERLGIEDVRAELLPEGKVGVIRELEERGERVAFVGDGVNDAPALARATLGLAMGAAGTDVALETADIALMADDLSKLPLAIGLSRRTLRIIKVNILFSLAIKAVFIVMALTGLATLWMAVAADMGASLVVVANGLRALRVPDTAGHPA